MKKSFGQTRLTHFNKVVCPARTDVGRQGFLSAFGNWIRKIHSEESESKSISEFVFTKLTSKQEVHTIVKAWELRLWRFVFWEIYELKLKLTVCQGWRLPTYEVTISRYESKAIQDEVYDTMLRLVKNNSLQVLELLKKNKHKFTPIKNMNDNFHWFSHSNR